MYYVCNVTFDLVIYLKTQKYPKNGLQK